MMIAPINTPHAPDYWFLKLNKLRNELSLRHHQALALSMGMSDDFTLAIAHGADVLRIGTRIFGPRS